MNNHKNVKKLKKVELMFCQFHFLLYLCDRNINSNISMARKDFLKVRIRNSGEDDATIVREMTKEEYEFLLDIAQDLNCEGEEYSPILYVDILENE